MVWEGMGREVPHLLGHNRGESKMLTFLKEWLPSLAVIVGGLWLLFQWLFGERLRRQKEMPALDGNFSARVVPVSPSSVIVSLSCIWRNRGPLPARIDPGLSHIDVFQVPEDCKNGPLILDSNLGGPIYQPINTTSLLKSSTTFWNRTPRV